MSSTGGDDVKCVRHTRCSWMVEVGK